MLFSKCVSIVAVLSAADALTLRGVERDLSPTRLNVLPSRVLQQRQNGNKCLNANAIQTGSLDDGQNPPVAGQTASATDDENFINFCSGKTVTNGLQVQGGSCNGIVMGEIPSNNNMISAIIVSPKPGENLAADTTFTISVQVTGLQAGAFTNAQKTYYAAPQKLNGQGQVIGHTHVSVQDLGNSLQPNQPPNAKTFVFFKGINDAGNGNGLLSAVVTGGLPAGNYRCCTMTSSSNHQPVLMPIAQRGPQDDCQKFTVGGNANNNNGGNNAGGAGGAANAGGNAGENVGNTGNQGGNAGGNAGNGAAASSSTTTTSVAAPTATAGVGGNNGGNNNNTGGNQGGNQGGKPGGGNAAAGTFGGAAPAVTDSGNKDRPFAVNGNTFVNKSAAVQRSCDIQRNACFDAVNGGKAQGFTSAQCDTQATACQAQG